MSPDRSASEPAQTPPLDPLSEVLRDFRLAGVSYGHCRLTRPWGVHIDAESPARLHFVIHGRCWLRMGDAEPTALQPGDVVLLPSGAAHALSDTPRGATRPLASFPREEIGDRTYSLDAGGGGEETRMICCSVRFDQPDLHPLIRMMPDAFIVRDAMRDDPMLSPLLQAMADEVTTPRPGRATVLARLADVVVTRLVRAWAEGRHEDTAGWLAAIRDPKIGRALTVIHREPAANWSIAALANVAHMSRSMFQERFTLIVGMPPARYIARWRMHLASGWLRHDRLAVTEVAERLGYDSEAAFSRAFKRITGTPPSTLRSAPAPRRADASRTARSRSRSAED